ncbi:MAG: S1C family serine protease, partial [Actinomycetota bacterium]|nr:S1C family serine protease [Actinomycetota bacterium]
AVGSPLGLGGGPSVTVGVVSAFGRQVTVAAETTLFGMLQTDAPITEGSSGGALVDTAGRLIGITTAVGVSTVGVEGIGFATPVELMSRVVDELVADGAVDHAFLGIRGATTFDVAPDGARVAAGVQIESVEPGTPADEAGLARGDIIISVDGEPIETMGELVIVLRYRGAGDSLTFTVAPAIGESARSVDVVLGAL